VIRKELKKNLSSQTRFEEDKQRTIVDYFRMGLDKGLDKGMVDATYAYMQNTPGSKKALKEIFSKKKLKAPLKVSSNQETNKEIKNGEPEKNVTKKEFESEDKLAVSIKYKVTVKTGKSF
jgi:hypothetical protein